ncbi:polysaccharide pyruvyl transferase family protein [Niabella sp.]|uniref:polysaccharide pyruvyl transferase family protein n=1 Tax=Niabella sp. TaxID=1962976 RepID=UPI00262BA84C|nr:polysaccharide pyruvyl transferase family protein [Niabella sp.]
MKYGLLNYEESADGLFNIGDHIQSLAAEQYLPQVDRLVYRDHLNENLGEKHKIIMNGWFTYKPENWPPTADIIPLFISFHLNQAYAERLLSKQENVDYLKSNAPIGCRDYSTLQHLQRYGIDAFYSFCLTTTLGLKYKLRDENERTDEILMVDVLFKENFDDLYKLDSKRKIIHLLNGKYYKKGLWKKKIRSLIPDEILSKAIYISHAYKNKDIPRTDRFEYARNLLRRYARAKLVITSRIHCALPCLAVGTPVIFVHGGGLKHENEIARLSGTIEHLNVLLDHNEVINDETRRKYPNLLVPGEFDWNNIKNPENSKAISEKLQERCFDFIQNDQ